MSTTAAPLQRADGATPLADGLEGLLLRRSSCRAFLDRAVPRPVIERMLRMAQRSPSWCNTQPWQLVVTDGEATAALRAALAQHLSDPIAPDLPFPDEYIGVYDQRRKACGWSLYESIGIARGDREASARQARRNFEFFDAPHVAILTTARSLGVYGAVDCGVYLGTLLIAAESLGLAAVPQAALAAYSPFLHQYFDLPADRQVICAVSLGYADPDAAANRFRTERAPIDEVVTWWPPAPTTEPVPTKERRT